MSRPLRLAFPGAVSPVTSRQDPHLAPSHEDADRPRFLKFLQDVITRSPWLCYAYGLMDHHDHLLIETPEGHLSEGMRP